MYYKTERDLNSHIRQAHTNSPQFDGTCDEIPFTFESEFAKEDVLYTLEEVLTDEINVELISRTKVADDVRSADYVFSIRVCPPSMDWKWLVMNQIQREVLKNLLLIWRRCTPTLWMISSLLISNFNLVPDLSLYLG